MATVQIPVVPGEGWIGSAWGSARPNGPRVQVTLTGGPIADPTSSLAGLLIDEWTETVANGVPATGLAYHYQSPLSEPPQAVLLAVPADLSLAVWTTDTLERALSETLALAKIRCVDQDALAKTGQLLPAFYLANNVSGDTVSTDVMAQPAVVDQ
jgi:hypothetical protein